MNVNKTHRILVEIGQCHEYGVNITLYSLPLKSIIFKYPTLVEIATLISKEKIFIKEIYMICLALNINRSEFVYRIIV